MPTLRWHHFIFSKNGATIRTHRDRYRPPTGASPEKPIVIVVDSLPALSCSRLMVQGPGISKTLSTAKFSVYMEKTQMKGEQTEERCDLLTSESTSTGHFVICAICNTCFCRFSLERHSFYAFNKRKLMAWSMGCCSAPPGLGQVTLIPCCRLTGAERQAITAVHCVNFQYYRCLGTRYCTGAWSSACVRFHTPVDGTSHCGCLFESASLGLITECFDLKDLV